MIKNDLLFTSIVILLVSFFSCTQKHAGRNDDFSSSKIYPSVSCQQDTNLTYALFLPPGYDKSKSWPVLILFDPHGDGLLPVNLFSSEAARNGFIIAGSNNSKNGMPIENTTTIYRKILSDLAVRFTIDKKAIYLGGFSGGSRVAGAAAITEGGVAGVVGCGAGLPNTNSKPVSPFSYLAVVGNQDFNYTEMQQVDKSLGQAGYQHYLLVFEGIHQWPPDELIPDIFTWLRFDAMKKQALPMDRAEINRFIEKYDKTASVFASQNQLYQEREVYLKMLHYLDGLTDVSPLQVEIKSLADKKEVIGYDRQKEQLLLMEQDLQQKYTPEIERQNIVWWTMKASLLHSLSVKSGSPEMNLVYKRVSGFLSLNCYMYSTNAVKQKDITAASKYIEIYRLIDPSNAEHRFLAAKVAAINNDKELVFTFLKQAFELGFKDIKRLKSDADLKQYLDDVRFKDLPIETN